MNSRWGTGQNNTLRRKTGEKGNHVLLTLPHTLDGWNSVIL